MPQKASLADRCRDALAICTKEDYLVSRNNSAFRIAIPLIGFITFAMIHAKAQSLTFDVESYPEYRHMCVISGTGYEERAEAVLTQMASMELPSDHLTFKHIGPYVFSRLNLGRDEEACNRAYDAMLDQGIRTLTQNTSLNQFNVHAAMHGYLMNRKRLTNGNREKLKLYLSKTDVSLLSKGTINMSGMYTSSMLLACDEWPDLTDCRAMATREIRAICKERVVQLLNDFFFNNGCEIDAFTYFATNLPWVRMLAEHAREAEVQQMAFHTYQKMIATLVSPWNRGYYNNCPYRSKGWHNLLTGPYALTGINQVAWVFFGNESNESLHYARIGDARASLPTHAFWVSYRGQVKALPELLAAEKNRQFPYEFRTLMIDSNCDYHKYTWQSDNYGLSTQTECHKDLANADRSYGYKEIKRTFLQWRSDCRDCVFSVCQDNPQRPRDEVNRNPMGYGENPFHRVAQFRRAAIGVFNVPESYLKGRFYQLYVPFSQRGIKLRTERDGWVFCHTGSMMFAFRTLAPYVWNKAIFSSPYYDMLSPADPDARKGAWVLETTEITAEFRSDSIEQELSRFSEKLLNKPRVEERFFDSDTPAISYTALDGNVLELEFFPPTQIYDGQYKLNGKPLPLDEKNILDSPFVRQTRTSPVFVTNGRHTSTIGFSKKKEPK